MRRMLELNLCDVVKAARQLRDLAAYERKVGLVWLAVVFIELLESEDGQLPVIFQKLLNHLSPCIGGTTKDNFLHHL